MFSSITGILYLYVTNKRFYDLGLYKHNSCVLCTKMSDNSYLCYISYDLSYVEDIIQ